MNAEKAPIVAVPPDKANTIGAKTRVPVVSFLSLNPILQGCARSISL
jgi:hypothetical protein